jgi:hypothetical protein
LPGLASPRFPATPCCGRGGADRTLARAAARFRGTIDNPEFTLYKMIPNRVGFTREWALEYHEVVL